MGKRKVRYFGPLNQLPPAAAEFLRAAFAFIHEESKEFSFAWFDEQTANAVIRELFHQWQNEYLYGNRFPELQHQMKSRPASRMSDRELHKRRFQAAYQSASGSHTKRVESAGRAIGIKRRTAFGYAAELGLRSKQNGA